MAACFHCEDVVVLDGRRGIVDEEWHRYPPRPGVFRVLVEGGGRAWVTAEDVEKLPTVFLGMPNEEHAPAPGEPLTLWQEIPHGFDSYLWSDASWDEHCMYCGLPRTAEIHIRS